jgi:hypothetical protein
VFVNGLDDGDDAYAASLVLTPVECLAIRFGVPFAFGGGEGKAKDIWADSFGQVTFNIKGVGEIAVSFDASPKSQKAAVIDSVPATGYHFDPDTGTAVPNTGNVDSRWAHAPSTLYASFNLSAVEKLGLNFGVKYGLPVSEDTDGIDFGATYLSPFKIGLGASYQVNDLFGIKARLYAGFGGKTKWDVGDPDPALISFELQPNLTVKVMKIALNFGMDITAADKDWDGDTTADSNVKWWVTPYISKSIGGGAVWVGVNIVGTPTNEAPVNGVAKFGSVIQ